MFRGDTRGQSVQVGVIILLAFAVIGFSSYQAVVVPQQNQEVEFDHSREVQQDIVDTRNAIVRAANAGQNGAASIQLGQDFPARIFALNAPAASGRFATTDRGDITVTNSDGDVCPGPDKTVRASYTPSYSYYNNAPTTKYENTFVFSEFDDGTERVQTRARLLFGEDDGPGGTVNLVALFGETRQSGTEAVSLDLYSGTSDTESITGPNVTLPTSAKAPTWAEALGYDSVTDIENTTGVNNLSVSGNEVTIDLAGEYDVVCTEVGMDTAPPSNLSAIAPIPSSGGDNGDEGGRSGLSIPTFNIDTGNTDKGKLTVQEVEVTDNSGLDNVAITVQPTDGSGNAGTFTSGDLSGQTTFTRSDLEIQPSSGNYQGENYIITVTGTNEDGDTVTLSRELNPRSGSVNTILEADSGDKEPTAVDIEVDNSYDGEYAAAKIGIRNTQTDTAVDKIVSLETRVSSSSASQLDASEYAKNKDNNYGIVAYFESSNQNGKIVQSSVDIGQVTEFDQKGGIDAGSRIVLKLNEFQDSSGAPVDLKNKEVTLVIEFMSDGNRYREEITVTLDRTEQVAKE
ncbi:hypothetical protein BRD20_00505 [Halobacteriales archaeon SW_8_65_20]|nr:MAG: hypothetical protein BRD20_00505 [Halobacteriales archaeon SW_8_65_20]